MHSLFNHCPVWHHAQSVQTLPGLAPCTVCSKPARSGTMHSLFKPCPVWHHARSVQTLPGLAQCTVCSNPARSGTMHGLFNPCPVCAIPCFPRAVCFPPTVFRFTISHRSTLHTVYCSFYTAFFLSFFLVRSGGFEPFLAQVFCVFDVNRLCGPVGRVYGYRYRGGGFDSRRYQIILSSSGSE